MRKYSLLGILGLLILGGGVIRRYLGQNNPLKSNTVMTNSLIGYLPTSVDQAMIVNIEPGTKEFLIQSNTEVDPINFGNVLDTIEQIVIAQATDDMGSSYAGVFIQGNQQFSIDQVEALGLLYLETGYVSQQIDTGIRLYADQVSLGYFSQPTQKLTERPEIKIVLREMKARDASVVFYSRPNTQTGSDPLTAAFAEKLAYTALYSNPTASSSKGSFVLQFSGTDFKISDDIFTPMHTKSVGGDTLLYIESSHLLSTFGVDASQFGFAVPLLLEQTAPGIGALVSAEQWKSLYTALDNHLGIVVNLTPSAFGIGIQLIMKDPEVYTTLIALAPLWKSLVGSLMGEEAMNALTQTNSSDERSLEIKLPTLAATGSDDLLTETPTLPVVRVEKDGENTSLSLMSESIQPTATVTNPDLSYHTDSLLTFRIDQLVLSRESSQTNPFITNMIGQSSLMGSGAIIGDIRIDEKNQQLLLEFQTK